MKKFIFTIAAFVLGISQMSAQKLVFGDVDLPLGGQATLTVKYETGGESLTSASFTLALPDGVSSEKTSAGKSKFVLNADMAESFAAYTTAADGYSVAATATGVEFPGTSGVLGTVTLIAAEDAANLKIGESYPVTVSGLSLVKRSDAGLVSISYDDITFNVNIVENRIPLDENSTTAPAAAENVNILVKRTIIAGNWSTLCLPFSMTAEQVTEAFGSDVELADYTGWTWTEDDNFDKKSITIQFTSCNTITENKPLIIKTSANISEFKLDGVTINPADAEIEKKESVDNKRKGTMVGTYVANTKVDEDCLFLSGNNFYYSTGNTKMKAFRAYFDLYYTLDEPYKSSVSASNVKISVDGEEATAIDGMNFQRVVEGVYDLSGRKIQLENGDLNKLQKGVYIIDGKKVTIK